MESAFLLIGLLILFMHASFFRTPYLIIPVMPIQCWIFTIELIELRSKRGGYFSDLWNLFDLLRFLFTFIYFIVAILEAPSQTTKSVVLTLLTFSQSMKAFTLFSLFRATRVLLRIVIEIVKDMVPFLLFVTATTLAVALLFTSATINDDLQLRTYPNFLTEIFLLDFGDFTPKGYSPLEQCIFILAAITVPLVLMNMLIAIMGDTFDRVKEEQSRRDYQEMVGLVNRYETIASKFCCSRGSSQKPWKYIFYSSETKKEGEAVVDAWEGRIRGIKKELERMQKKNEEWQRKSEEE